MISAEKQMFRAQARERLRTLSFEDREEASRRISGHLRAQLGGARMIFGFAPLRSEPNWTLALDERWRLAFPRVDETEMTFHETLSLEKLAPGPFGTLEPVESHLVKAEAAEIILVPALAFDHSGKRLGRGGGFYDRFLAAPTLRAARVGVCFDVQLFEKLPTEAHDMEVEAIVTESGWIELSGSGWRPA